MIISARKIFVWLVVAHAFCTTSTAAVQQQQQQPPNIVFLVCESTDGRTWQRGYQNDVIPLPNIRKLESMGAYSFYRHYTNAPVCCPSRASFWSGRYPHHLPNLHNGIPVEGVWNNYEGLPSNYNETMFHLLKRNGYDTLLSGKHDYVAGGHSLNARLTAWTMYTRFPYNISNGGWNDDPSLCRRNGTVHPDTGTESRYWSGDWTNVNSTIQWIHNMTKNQTKPFFAYQGMDIVHPAYVTNQRYYDSIDPRKVRVPPWPSIKDLHPCDFQSVMRKGCLPSSANESDAFYSHARRRDIRRIYYAMILEFDAMVGRYMRAVQEAGVWNNTIFIITSDHGDMQMEHQQHYKMVPYDGSSSVPLVIFDGRAMSAIGSVEDRIVHNPTQHVDLFPTIMEYAGITKLPPGLNGYSLLTLMRPYKRQGTSTYRTLQQVRPAERPDFIVSQFHGDCIAMSWFLIVRPMPCFEQDEQNCLMKLVVWGTGKEVDSQLFDLTNDPDEIVNLIHSPDYSSIVESLDAALKTVVDYEHAALDVAAYNKKSFEKWIQTNSNWKDIVQGKQMSWHQSWEEAGQKALKSLEDWLSRPAEVAACRSDMVWPPSSSGNDL